jgi:two-component system, chemotaxis family, sensor kinase CheA
MDMSPYRDLFVSEARNHLSALSELIVRLEDSPTDSAAIDELFRHAHSLKGMAATMGYKQVVGIAHLMEDQLSRVRSGDFLLSPVLVDLLLEGCDALSRLVTSIETGNDIHEDSTGLTDRLAAFDSSAEQKRPSETIDTQSTTDSARNTPVSASRELRQTDSFKSIRIKTETLDRLVNITGDLITNRHRLAESIQQAGVAECREPLHQLTALLRNLRDEVFKARMLPFAFIAEHFPRLVRDLARKQGKEIHFQLSGKEIELDRGILEEISEPIVHILRNAVDHGLETTDERVMAGKPFDGTITLAVCRDKEAHFPGIRTSDDAKRSVPTDLRPRFFDRRSRYRCVRPWCRYGCSS